MSATTEIAIYLVRTAVGFYLMLVLLRFLLQLARADFYNPISQFIVKATNPPLRPLRRIIPGLWGVDFAALALALLVQMLGLQIMLLILGAGLINPVFTLAWSAISILATLTSFYFFSVLASIIVSWVAPTSNNPVIYLLHQLNEPVMNPLRRLLPPMGGLDFSPILVFVLLNVLNIAINDLAVASQMPTGQVLGL
jgi:YggT family protein